MAEIIQLTQDGRLIEDWQKINANFTNLNNDKAEKSTTLSGYGITDAYDKNTIDAKLEEVTPEGYPDVVNKVNILWEDYQAALGVI